MTETFARALQRGIARLESTQGAGATRDARDILAWAAGVAPMRVSVEAQRILSDQVTVRYDQGLAERSQHRPVAQIIGTRAFWGRDFRVTRDVLDPRPETETLIAQALGGPSADHILDLGTGTGILALTLLAEWPKVRAVATDISPAALAVARDNAVALGVIDRVTLVRSDWVKAVTGEFNLIVSNPPYIPASDMPTLADDVRNWEPHLALTPGGDGLGAYRAIVRGLPGLLAPRGRVLFECGPGQAQAVVRMLRSQGAGDSAVHRDLNGHKRIVEGWNFS